MHLLPQFLSEWLKQTSFCRELGCLDRDIRSFCVFDIFPLKKHNTDDKALHSHENKFKIFFKKNLFKNWKKLGMWSPAPSVCKWNKVINFVLSLKLLAKMNFLLYSLKAYIFYIIRLLYVLPKKTETNFCWPPTIIILFLKRFSLRWIIKDFFVDPFP